MKEEVLSESYQTALSTAVQSTGEHYVRARNVLIQDSIDVQYLHTTINQKKNWQEEWVARIALAWREENENRKKLEQYLSGDLPGPVPITGRFDQKARANTIVQTIGEQCVPFLIENMWKLQNYDDDVQLATVALTLEKCAVPETEIPLVYLLDAPGTEHYRNAAILILGGMKSWTAFPHIQKILLNKKESELTRSAALGAFNAFDSKDKIETLQRLVTDTGENDQIRSLAANSLAWEKNADMKPFFHAVIRQEKDYSDKILVEAVNCLKRQGDQTSIDCLETLQKQRSAPALQKAIDKALQRIRKREQK
jgi:HEAT repeat protein